MQQPVIQALATSVAPKKSHVTHTHTHTARQLLGSSRCWELWKSWWQLSKCLVDVTRY